METKNNNTLLILVVVVGFVLYNSPETLKSVLSILGGLLNKPNVVNVTPNVVPKEPSGEYKDAIQTVLVVLKGSLDPQKSADAVALSNLYRDFAKLIRNDLVKTTGQIKTANSLSGRLMDLNIRGKYQGLGDAVDGAIKKVLGDESKTLDSNSRDRAIQVFEALSWACYEGSK